MYRVFKYNCYFKFLSDRHLKREKWQNPAIFVKLTYGHFDVLMSRVMFDDGNDLLGLFPNSVIAPPYMD